MLIDHDSDLDQYDIRKSPAGQWEIYDLDTGLVVVLNGSPLHGLFVEEAQQAAELLNQERKRRMPGAIH